MVARLAARVVEIGGCRSGELANLDGLGGRWRGFSRDVTQIRQQKAWADAPRKSRRFCGLLAPQGARRQETLARIDCDLQIFGKELIDTGVATGKLTVARRGESVPVKRRARRLGWLVFCSDGFLRFVGSSLQLNL